MKWLEVKTLDNRMMLIQISKIVAIKPYDKGISVIFTVENSDGTLLRESYSLLKSVLTQKGLIT
jgi:hypothetical protein